MSSVIVHFTVPVPFIGRDPFTPTTIADRDGFIGLTKCLRSLDMVNDAWVSIPMLKESESCEYVFSTLIYSVPCR